MKKKVTAVLLSAMMAMSLAACAGTSDAPAENTGAEASTEEATEAADAAADTSEEASTEGDTDAVVSELPEGEQLDPEFGVEPEGRADDTVSADGTTLTTPYFSVKVPADWDGKYTYAAYDTDGNYSLSFQNKECADNNEGGYLCTIQVSAEPPEFIEYIGGDFLYGLREKGSKDGVSYYVAVSYPTDVQFGEKTQDAYMKMYDEKEKLTDSITPASSYEKVEIAYAEAMKDVEFTEDGVLLDAAMHSFTIQTRSGDILTFSGEDLDTATMANALLLGHCYELTYKGIIGEDGSTKDATFVNLENIDDTLPETNPQALYTASQVVLAFHMKSLDYLAGICRFPIKVDGKTVQTQEDLAAMDFDTVCSDDLQRNVQYCDLVDSSITGDRFSISLVQSAPEVVIEKDKEAETWSVTEINNK